MKSTKRSPKLFKGRRMKMKLKCEESKSLYAKLGNLKKYPSNELKVSIQLKLVAMDFWKKCQSLNFVRELNSKNVKLNKTPSARDKKIFEEKTKRPKIFYQLLARLKRQGIIERSLMIKDVQKSFDNNKNWKQRKRPCEKRDS
jgi:hypothetical protein